MSLEDKKNKFTSGTADVSSLVSSVINPAYKIVNEFVPKKITLSKHVWTILTIIILLICIKLNFLSLNSSILLFCSVFLLELISLNIDAVKTFFKGNKNEKIIEDFIKNLKEKNLNNILYFLENKTLDTETLTKAIETKYGGNIDLHKKIIKFQDLDCVLVDNIVESRFINFLPPRLLSMYIFWLPTTLNHKSFEFFEKINNCWIRGALVVTHSIKFKVNSIVKKVLHPFLLLDIWFSNMFRSKQYKLLFLFLLTVTLMFFNKSLLIDNLNSGQKISEFILFFVVNMLFSGIIMIISMKIYFNTSIPFWGFIYKEKKENL